MPSKKYYQQPRDPKLRGGVQSEIIHFFALLRLPDHVNPVISRTKDIHLAKTECKAMVQPNSPMTATACPTPLPVQ